jgi:hypothetical protein
LHQASVLGLQGGQVPVLQQDEGPLYLGHLLAQVRPLLACGGVGLSGRQVVLGVAELVLGLSYLVLGLRQLALGLLQLGFDLGHVSLVGSYVGLGGGELGTVGRVDAIERPDIAELSVDARLGRSQA